MIIITNITINDNYMSNSQEEDLVILVELINLDSLDSRGNQGYGGASSYVTGMAGNY